jgi:heptosyltransferase-3
MREVSIRNNHINKILLVKHRNIGDVLLATPTIKVLREHFPRAYIAMVVNSGTEEMVTGNPYLDEVIVFYQGLKKLPPMARFKEQMRFIFDIRKRNFDLTINLTEGDRGAILCLLSGARDRVGYHPRGKGLLGKRYIFTHLVKPNLTRHMVEYNLDAMRVLGINPKDKKVSIYWSQRDKEYVDYLLSKFNIERGDSLVHVHPTSRWLFKCWNDLSFAETIDWLAIKKNIRVVLTSSAEKKELKKVNMILSMCKSTPVNLSGLLTLKQLAALSKRCQLFVGIDSAPMHIAAAVGTPVIVLFGPSRELNWGPWGNGHMVIKKDWKCIPCGKDGCSGSKVSLCLEAITPEEVQRAIDSKLKDLTGKQC